MRSLFAVAALAVMLAACGQDSQVATEEAPAAMMDEMGVVAPMEAGESARSQAADQPAQASGGGAPAQPSAPTPVLYLAYSYAIGFELPSQNLIGVMDSHIEACQAAGPRQCQLIGSNRSGDPESYLEGYVSLRGEPGWLRTFRANMEAQADAAGGRIVSQTTNSEDLTRAIVDTEARLRAQTALRDRLQRLLESRPGRLADLLEVERELARVQADIDAVQSNLAVMRTRVSMSELNLSYRSVPRSVGSDTFEPLRDALANFLRVVVIGFAAIITIVAGLLPFAIVLIPIVWGLLRWRKARGGRFFGPREATPRSE
ncbi:MAG: DUF4349 domain-containing protein [Hyphomonadaceae bacterium]|nr:DUF4349 domain-containing protein [Hyphomonadaceae bacterium]